MKSEARTAIALFCGAATLALAVGCGDTAAKSPSGTTPSTTMVTAGSSPAEPGDPGNGATGTTPAAEAPDGDTDTGCIPGLNCGPIRPRHPRNP